MKAMHRARNRNRLSRRLADSNLDASNQAAITPRETRRMKMNKKEAQKIWNKEVKDTAKAWRSEFGEQALDPEWSATGFEDIPSEVIRTLELSDPWREFHDAVESKL
jgi:hypothetical protein